jgi:DNA repair protein RecO (recombination protein O)
MSRRAKVAAVVLRSVDYGDADRVVTLLTEERGKISAFARGARASKRRFGGALEPFTLLDAELTERASSDLWTLDSVSVRRGFGSIRQDLARIGCAGYACELARELVREGEAQPELFALVVEYLERLDARPADPTALRAFELRALRAAGVVPRLDACARCGGSFAADARLRLDPGEGGALCGRCGPAHARAPIVSAETAAALSRLLEGDFDGAAGVPLPQPSAVEARDALAAYIEHHLGKRLQSRKFLDEIAPMLGRDPVRNS